MFRGVHYRFRGVHYSGIHNPTFGDVHHSGNPESKLNNHHSESNQSGQ